jgi:hypothetical protein
LAEVLGRGPDPAQAVEVEQHRCGAPGLDPWRELTGEIEERVVGRERPRGMKSSEHGAFPWLSTERLQLEVRATDGVAPGQGLGAEAP